MTRRRTTRRRTTRQATPPSPVPVLQIPPEGVTMRSNRDRTRMIPLDRLVTNPIQAYSRRRRPAMPLAQTMLETRECVSLIVVAIPERPGYYWYADGEGRAAALRLLGLHLAECVVSDDDPRVLYVKLNSVTRIFTGCTWAEVYAIPNVRAERDQILACMPVYSARRWQKLIDIIGEEEVVRLVREYGPFSPTTYDWIKKLYDRFDLEHVRYDRRAAAIWVIRFKAQWHVKQLSNRFADAAESRSHLRLIAEAIAENRPYRPTQTTESAARAARGWASASASAAG